MEVMDRLLEVIALERYSALKCMRFVQIFNKLSIMFTSARFYSRGLLIVVMRPC